MENLNYNIFSIFKLKYRIFIILNLILLQLNI